MVKKKSTFGEISQISRIALFYKNIKYSQDLRNCERSRQQTYMDDEHLFVHVFNGFHFVVRHFRFSLEAFKQKTFFTLDFFNILLNVKNSNVP